MSVKLLGVRRVLTSLAATAVLVSAAALPVAAATPSIPPDAPGTAFGLAVVPGNGQATLYWKVPTPSSGLSGVTYAATARTASGALAGTCSVPYANSELQSCVISGLGGDIRYQVIVIGDSSTGVASAPSGAVSVIPFGPPAMASGVTVTPSNHSATVEWAIPIPLSTHGSLDYVALFEAADGSAAGTCSAKVETSTSLSCSVSGLMNGSEYSVVVEGISDVSGAGPQTHPVAFQPATVPGVATDIKAVAVDKGAEVSWQPPVDDGGSPITTYVASAYDEKGQLANSCVYDVKSSAGNWCTVLGLTNGTTYSFKVTAANAMGSSDSSLPSLPATPEIGNAGSLDEFFKRLVDQSGIDYTQSGATASVALPPTTRVGGVMVEGQAALHVESDKTIVISADAKLPEIFGSTQAVMEATFIYGVGLKELTVSANNANIAELFVVDDVTMIWNTDGGWTIGGSVSTVPQELSTTPASRVEGSIGIGQDGTITSASISMSDLPLVGMFQLTNFTISYDPLVGWDGAASVANEATTLAVEIGFTPQGQLTNGLIETTGKTELFGVLEISQFKLAYTAATSGWEVGITAAPFDVTKGTAGPTPGETAFGLTLENGVITGANFSLSNVSFKGIFEITKASFAYSNLSGTETYAATVGVVLPGTSGTEIAGSFTLSNGQYAQGSVEGNQLSVALGSTGGFLQTINAALDAPWNGQPWRIEGGVGLSVGPAVAGVTAAELRGNIEYKFPHVEEAYGTFSATGTLYISGSALGVAQVSLSNANGLHLRLSLGPGDGTTGLGYGSLINVKGVLTGQVTPEFLKLSGTGTFSLLWFGASGEVVLSSKGFAGCGRVSDGVTTKESGFIWNWGEPPTSQTGTCSIAAYETRPVSPTPTPESPTTTTTVPVESTTTSSTEMTTPTSAP